MVRSIAISEASLVGRQLAGRVVELAGAIGVGAEEVEKARPIRGIGPREVGAGGADHERHRR